MSVAIDSVQHFSGPQVEGRTVRTARSTNAEIYPKLARKLVDAEQPDPAVAFVLAVCAGYSYSDVSTVQAMVNRLGLVGARCVAVPMTVDAMYIRSTGYVIQSADGEVVIVSYRGTEPVSIASWLTDADVAAETVRLDLDHLPGDEEYGVHAGFYRNVRATRFAMIDLLRRALAGKSILPGDDTQGLTKARAIYLTGHSLGGAMAALLTIMLHENPNYVDIKPVVRATYTYGQPMVGNRALAGACARRPFQHRLFRYVHGDDLVPHLPPRESGAFVHFGLEYRCDRRTRDLRQPEKPAGQTVGPGIVVALAGLVGGVFAGVPRISLPFSLPFSLPLSLGDHAPHHYIAALKPPDVDSEFGD
ncbi:MAG TPA: lipase family protein [Aldersonia sp.]